MSLPGCSKADRRPMATSRVSAACVVTRCPNVKWTNSYQQQCDNLTFEKLIEHYSLETSYHSTLLSKTKQTSLYMYYPTRIPSKSSCRAARCSALDSANRCSRMVISSSSVSCCICLPVSSRTLNWGNCRRSD